MEVAYQRVDFAIAVNRKAGTATIYNILPHGFNGCPRTESVCTLSTAVFRMIVNTSCDRLVTSCKHRSGLQPDYYCWSREYFAILVSCSTSMKIEK